MTVKQPTRNVCRLAKLTILCGLLAAGVLAAPPVNPAGGGDNDPAARFRGAPTYDLAVTNVKWEVVTKDYSEVTFDLSWGHSWRSQWVEPAATSASGKDMQVESWDAVWVFVKFLPEKDSNESLARNHWRHAALSSAEADHLTPDGATHMLKLSDDGSRGMGVFVYRDAIGHGPNNFKGIKLRWMHGEVDPAKAALRVHSIAMVYVPEGPFKVGADIESGYATFSDGPDIPLMRYDGEQSYTQLPEGLRDVIESTTRNDGGPYIRWAHAPSPGALTDGAWRGGRTIPFLVDAEWNAPAAEGTRGRRVGPTAGHLWNTHTFVERSAGSMAGGIGTLRDEFPTGYDAFYCMKYEMTQGQYVDFLNSLPPDVAAARAFVSSETASDAGMYSEEVTVDLGPGLRPVTLTERGGNTIRSSADMPGTVVAPTITIEFTNGENGDGIGALLEETFSDRKEKELKKINLPPVYTARCPFRKLLGVAGADVRAIAVWAGLRPMTGLEMTKAISGPHDPALPNPSAAWANINGYLEVADPGLPTERIVRGKSGWGSDRATRVGSCATADSDRGTARATYWGILEFDGQWLPSVSAGTRSFRGTHGDGMMPAGTPGAPFRRGFVEFKEIPADWPIWGEYLRRFASKNCRLVVSANNRISKPVPAPAAPVAVQPAARPARQPNRADSIKVANVKWEAGTKEYSTVSFDLAWAKSWRAEWEEPADRNVTGKPLKVESWDAAWVFVKYRPAGATDDLHATLSAKAQDHKVPAGAALEVGPNSDGTEGVGVFINRSAPGVGPNDFKNIKLRWMHPPSPRPTGDAKAGNAPAALDPSKVDLKIHGLVMVYVPEGAFASRSPWGHALQTITTPDATKPGGHLASGTNEVPHNPEWPNGFSAFYCMKYPLSQGQYVALLNSIRSGNYTGGRYSRLAHNNYRRFHSALYGFNGYTITTDAAGVFRADVPDRKCNLLSSPDIMTYMAWAGLRPMTNLEYEKVCRGPRAVATAADAWTPATCAPAVGLDPSVLTKVPAEGPGPSYWGIRELSMSGCVQEWAEVVQNVWGAGLTYKGLHGHGSPTPPNEWTWAAFGDFYHGGIWRGAGYGTVGQWVHTNDLNRMPWELIDASRTGRYGARAVRTVSIKADPNASLKIDALPGIEGADIGLFYLSGRFRNDGDEALKLELATPLPDACFPGGAAARVLMAAPKAVTPFKILTVLTHDTALGAVVRTRMLPVRIETAGGDVLAKAMSRMPMLSAPAGATPVIGSLEGGVVTLRISNTTDRAHALSIELDSSGFKLVEARRSVTVEAGAQAHAAFRAGRQALAGAGPRRIPYRVSVANAAPQEGGTVVELRPVSRWWITRRLKAGPKITVGDEGPGDGLGGIEGLDDLVSYDRDIFNAAQPPQGWEPATYGSAISFGAAGELPSRGSTVLAATRVQTLDDREAVIDLSRVPRGEEVSLTFMVWFNDTVVFKVNANEQKESKPFRMRKTGNTMMVECRSVSDGPVAPGDMLLTFRDAKTGKAVDDLLFEVDKK